MNCIRPFSATGHSSEFVLRANIVHGDDEPPALLCNDPDCAGRIDARGCVNCPLCFDGGRAWLALAAALQERSDNESANRRGK